MGKAEEEVWRRLRQWAGQGLAALVFTRTLGLLEDFLGDWDSYAEESAQPLLEWFFFGGLLPGGVSLLEVWAQEEAALMLPAESAVLGGWAERRIGAFRLSNVGDREVQLTDLFGPEVYRVRIAPHRFWGQKGDLWLGWVFRGRELSAGGILFPAAWEAALRSEAAADHPGGPDFWRQHPEAPHRWFYQVAAGRGFSLVDSQGDEAMPMRAVYASAGSQARKTIGLVFGPAESGGYYRLISKAKGGGQLGRLHLEGNRRIYLEADSRGKLEKAKDVLQKVLGSSASHQFDVILPRSPRPCPSLPADFARLWVRRPLAALGGRTPRQMLRTITGRRRLEEILGALSRLPVPVPVEQVRRELGLPVGAAPRAAVDEVAAKLLEMWPATEGDRLGRALGLWLDFVGLTAPRIDDPLVWVAALRYTVGRLEGSGETERNRLARDFGVSSAEVERKYRRLCRTLDLVPENPGAAKG